VTPKTIAAWQPFAGYRPAPGVFDELTTAPGMVRPHGEILIRSISSLGAEEFAARLDTTRRMVRDNDVTYNVYGDPQGMDRPWELDMLPLLIPPEVWADVEAALVQRAQLLNLVLADLYGEQRLVRERLLPAPLVYANPHFLRPCHGVNVPGGVYLHLHAADLARAPSGEWWVLADRTQAPSGAGYALANRIALSHSLPEAFRDCGVQRLAPFFRVLRETLFKLAPSRRDNPKVVLLTPGPHNETYFEHAYLARYLGFSLVEGGDLTVRDRSVFIKTVEGLQPVDVVLRRLDDAFCDPLELKGDSFLGIAGLVEATRAGRVAVANALGSGLVETSSILAFLPGLCRHFFDEDLKMPSVATWWCGQKQELQYVLEHLDELVIKPAFPDGTREPVFGATLSKKGKEALADEIRAHPIGFVGQEAVKLSTAPVWLGGSLEPRSILLRTYAAAGDDTYSVMPGGLTRVASSGESGVVSMQRGGSSKDTWVLTDGPVSQVTLLTPAGAPPAIERATGDLPSRVADNLFWLGRHAERLEWLVRVLRAAVSRLVDESPELVALRPVLVAVNVVPEAVVRRGILSEIEQEVLSVVFRERAKANLRATLNELRHIAWLVRDRLSVDTWRILNQLHTEVRTPASRERPSDALALLNRVISTLAAFSGMEMENMTRGHGWRFLEIGRRLERTINIVAVLRAALPATSAVGAGNASLLPLLEIADSSMTYRRRYFAQPQLAPVLDLLLCDDGNPRALAFQLNLLSLYLDRLPRDPRAPRPSREQQTVARLTARLRSADMSALAQAHLAGDRVPLGALLDNVASEASELSDTLAYYYFSHAVPQVS
jgi:uncharacterized circularly permuted ATP-grasp superfamily protein/uncharacterized alpha-E superfamily protein